MQCTVQFSVLSLQGVEEERVEQLEKVGDDWLSRLVKNWSQNVPILGHFQTF